MVSNYRSDLELQVRLVDPCVDGLKVMADVVFTGLPFCRPGENNEFALYLCKGRNRLPINISSKGTIDMYFSTLGIKHQLFSNALLATIKSSDIDYYNFHLYMEPFLGELTRIAQVLNRIYARIANIDFDVGFGNDHSLERACENHTRRDTYGIECVQYNPECFFSPKFIGDQALIFDTFWIKNVNGRNREVLSGLIIERILYEIAHHST